MERLHHQSEKLPPPDKAVETDAEQAGRHHEKVDAGTERQRQSEAAYEARRQAVEHALPTEQLAKGAETKTAQSGGVHHATSKNVSYRATMGAVRRKLPKAARVFSRIVHTRGVETASEVASRTVFRPLPLLGAGLAATVVTAVVYAIGRYKGYEITGGGWFLISFGVGYVLGLAIDFVRLILVRRRS